MNNQVMGFQSYNGMVTEISNGLQRTGEVCKALQMEETAQLLKRSEEKMKGHKFAIGILGEFKRGKSTVINALLGSEIMPSDILPASATMNRVTYGLEPRAQVHMRSGEIETIDVDQLIDYVTKLDPDRAAQAELVEEAIAFYPCKFCRDGVDIVDTPGLNDEGRMDRIVEEVIPKLDAVVMVITPDNPLSMSEAEFIRTKLMTSDVGRLIFLINKIDIVRQRDRQRVLENIRSRIEESILEKMRKIHGEDSDVFRNVQSKLADIRIFPVSALNALDGRVENDEELLQNSGILAFEEALEKMLTEERGALELGMPIAQIYRSCDQALERIETCRTALNSSREEFQQTEREMLVENQKLLEEQTQKEQDLNKIAKSAKQEMYKGAAACYERIEKKAEELIDRIALENPGQVLNDQVRQGIIDDVARQIDEATRQEMSLFSEQTICRLNEIIGRESMEVSKMITQHELSISPASQQDGDLKITLGSIALDTMLTYLTANLLPGFGGIITGYRSAGVKGALLGGGTAFASAIALAAVLGPIGIVGLPLATIACASGTVAGQAVCKKAFAKSRNAEALQKLKEEIRASFRESSKQMRMDREMEKWIDDTVEGQFSILIGGMKAECERVVKQANETINNIKMELVRDAQDKKHRMEEYDALQATIIEIQTYLEPLKEKIIGMDVGTHE